MTNIPTMKKEKKTSLIRNKQTPFGSLPYVSVKGCRWPCAGLGQVGDHVGRRPGEDRGHAGYAGLSLEHAPHPVHGAVRPMTPRHGAVRPMPPRQGTRFHGLSSLLLKHWNLWKRGTLTWVKKEKTSFWDYFLLRDLGWEWGCCPPAAEAVAAWHKASMPSPWFLDLKCYRVAHN